jgi:hypothetical protein
MTLALEQLAEETGMAATLIVGGPVPEKGGKLMIYR